MSELFDDDEPAPLGANAPEFTVSEISGAVKRVIEGEFGLVRVRGEISRVSRPASGHFYFDLKDDRASIAAIISTESSEWMMWESCIPAMSVPTKGKIRK